MTMTERYALYQTDKLRDRFALADGLPKGVKPRYNSSPTQLMPVVVKRDDKTAVELMKWGFIPHGAKDSNSVFRYKTFNARSEGIFDKPTWQLAIRTRRCLVPANGFYEWHKTSDGKKPYFITPTDQPLFSMAGVYSSWTDPDGREWGTFAIITIESHSSSLHARTRRPVILQPGDEAEWLDGSIEDMNILYAAMRSYSDDMLTIIPVGDAVNSIKPDKPTLIERV